MANATTPVSNLGGGGSKQPETDFGTLTCSTLTCVPQSTKAGMTIAQDPNNTGGLLWIAADESNLYSLNAVGSGSNTSMVLGGNTLSTGDWNLRYITSMTTTNCDMTLSTINGATPAAGTGSVASCSGDSFGSVIANPTSGAVVLSLAARAAQLYQPFSSSAVFSFAANNSEETAGFITDLSTELDVPTLQPGWYNITFNGFQLFLAQQVNGTSIPSVASPGSLIEHAIVVACGTAPFTKYTTYLQNLAVVGNTSASGLVYKQDTFLSLSGAVYVGANPVTMQLFTYYNNVTGGANTGGWQYRLPAAIPADYVTLQPITKSP